MDGIPGMGSGLDIKNIVKEIVNAKVDHMQKKHDREQVSVETEISAIGQIKSAFAGFKSSLLNLANFSQYSKMKTTISQQGFFSANVNSQALAGTYQVKVQSLAQAQNLSSNYFPSTATTVGDGTITINFGTYSTDLSTFTPNSSATSINLTIVPGNDSLAAICDTINTQNAGVKAAIIQDSQGARLSLTSTKTGANNAMQVISTINGLNYDPTTNNTQLTQTMAAQNSQAQINGITVNETTNCLKNVLPGITLNLMQADPTQTISLTVENNKEQLTNTVKEFVKQYNDCMTLLNTITSYDKEKKQPGLFQGDKLIKELKSSLYSTVTNFMAASSGSIETFKSIGIKTITGGYLEINQEKFNKALNEQYNTIGSMFAKTISVTDSTVQVNNVDADVPSGIYDISLTTFTPGVSMTGSIGGLPAISTDGVTLTGTGKYSSLSVNILAGGVGNRGQIVVTDGLCSLLAKDLDAYVDEKGLFDKRSNSLEKDAKHLKEEQDKIELRKTSLTQSYSKRWNSLDQLLVKLQSTSDELTKLLDSLPILRTKEK